MVNTGLTLRGCCLKSVSKGGASRGKGAYLKGPFWECDGGTIVVNLLWHSSKEQILLQSTMCVFLVSVSSTAYSDAVCRVSASHGISCY